MISGDALRTISHIFCGDTEGYFSYKSGPKLVSFFNEHFNEQDSYEQGFPSRWAFVYDKLVDLLKAGNFDSFLNLVLSKTFLMQDLNLSQVEACQTANYSRE